MASIDAFHAGVPVIDIAKKATEDKYKRIGRKLNARKEEMVPRISRTAIILDLFETMFFHYPLKDRIRFKYTLLMVLHTLSSPAIKSHASFEWQYRPLIISMLNRHAGECCSSLHGRMYFQLVCPLLLFIPGDSPCVGIHHRQSFGVPELNSVYNAARFAKDPLTEYKWVTMDRALTVGQSIKIDDVDSLLTGVYKSK